MKPQRKKNTHQALPFSNKFLLFACQVTLTPRNGEKKLRKRLFLNIFVDSRSETIYLDNTEKNNVIRRRHKRQHFIFYFSIVMLRLRIEGSSLATSCLCLEGAFEDEKGKAFKEKKI